MACQLPIQILPSFCQALWGRKAATSLGPLRDSVPLISVWIPSIPACFVLLFSILILSLVHITEFCWVCLVSVMITGVLFIWRGWLTLTVMTLFCTLVSRSQPCARTGAPPWKLLVLYWERLVDIDDSLSAFSQIMGHQHPHSLCQYQHKGYGKTSFHPWDSPKACACYIGHCQKMWNMGAETACLPHRWGGPSPSSVSYYYSKPTVHVDRGFCKLSEYSKPTVYTDRDFYKLSEYNQVIAFV